MKKGGEERSPISHLPWAKEYYNAGRKYVKVK